MPSFATVRSLFSWSCSATSLAVSNLNAGIPRHVADQERHCSRDGELLAFHSRNGVSRHPHPFG
jgi:hypothetical protein